MKFVDPELSIKTMNFKLNGNSRCLANFFQWSIRVFPFQRMAKQTRNCCCYGGLIWKCFCLISYLKLFFFPFFFFNFWLCNDKKEIFTRLIISSCMNYIVSWLISLINVLLPVTPNFSLGIKRSYDRNIILLKSPPLAAFSRNMICL